MLLLVKDAEAAGLVSCAFRHRSITKYYCVVSAGRVRKKEGRVEGNMVRARRGVWKMTHTTEDKHIDVVRHHVHTINGPA